VLFKPLQHYKNIQALIGAADRALFLPKKMAEIS
jgi:hypothetical protein